MKMITSGRTRLLVSFLVVAASLATVVGVVSASNQKASRKATKTAAVPVVFGDVADMTGPSSSSSGGYAPGLEVWAKWINAHGGIDGRQVKLTQIDGKGDPTTDLAAAHQLVAQNVSAMTNGSPNDAVFASYLNSQGMPNLGGLEDSSEDGATPVFFPTGTTHDDYAYAITDAAHIIGGHKVGIPYCTEFPGCLASQKFFIAAAPKVGLQFVLQVGISAAQPSYAAACLAFKSKGADVIIIETPSATGVRFAADCAKNGYKPLYSYSTQVFSPDYLKEPSLDKSVLTSSNLPYFTNNAAANTFRAAMQKYNPGFTKNVLYGETTFEAWIAGQLFAAAVHAAKVPASQPVTKEDVLRGLYALPKGTTLGGLTAPLNFEKGNGKTGHRLTCFYLEQISGGKVIPYKAGKPICP